MSNTILTQLGVQKVSEELEYIKSTKVPYADKRVTEALEYGDEEAIKDARDEQSFYQQRIVHLTEMLETAKRI